MKNEKGEQPEEERGIEKPGKPEFETHDGIRWIPEPTVPIVGMAAGHERPCRPLMRPPIPVLTCLDDGGLVTGQDFRLRDERFVIGRSEGDVMISCDKTVSSKHAEIVRVNYRGQYGWHLKDLDTANGTFVRVASSVFFNDTIVILGGRRFRLESPSLVASADDDDDGTRHVDVEVQRLGAWPRLVEAGNEMKTLSFQIRKPRMTLGGSGGGCDISIDDPWLAKHHATITLEANGQVKIRAEKTVNGVWANIKSIKLTNYCFFRCGEQVFRFIVP